MRGHLALLGLAAFLGTASPAAAQDTTLDTVEQLAAAGRLTDARATLGRWEEGNPETAGVPGEVRARALLLAARLAVDPEAAQTGYLAVALSYPTTAAAPEALLRLGQGLVASAQTGQSTAGRAVSYLERLVSDYPGNPYRTAGLLWLVRAQRLAGRDARACATAREALAVGVADPDVADLLQLEFRGRCEAGRDR